MGATDAVATGGWGVRGSELWVEEVPVLSLAERFGTPLYVISEARLRANARLLASALDRSWSLGATQILASLKASPSIALTQLLQEEGLGFDTFGPTEFELARRAHVKADLISVNGASKSRELIRDAVKYGARITVDSLREARLLPEVAAELQTTAMARVRVRPTYDIGMPSELSGGMSVADAASRYKAGIPRNDLVDAARLLHASPSIDLRGLHFHLGRHTAAPSAWARAAEAFAQVVAEVSHALGSWSPVELDVGGGWPSALDVVDRRERRRGADEHVDVALYATTVAMNLDRSLRTLGLAQEIKLEAEPGRALFGDAGLHLASVTNVKRELEPLRTWVETDTSDSFLADTQLESALFPVVSARDVPGSPAIVDVTGISCSTDLLAPGVALSSSLQEGDILAFLGTGAYQETTASNFNGLPRPASVLVSGQTARLIRRSETVDDVLSRDAYGSVSNHGHVSLPSSSGVDAT